VLAAIVVPWHVAAALRHPGFAWDYVVNQHVLFFLDRKLPRDSEGDSLAFFWAAATGRAAPWVLLVPLTLAEGGAGRHPAGHAGGAGHLPPLGVGGRPPPLLFRAPLRGSSTTRSRRCRRRRCSRRAPGSARGRASSGALPGSTSSRAARSSPAPGSRA